MFKKIFFAMGILLVSTIVSLGILYKVRSLPEYQKWPLKTESMLLGYFITQYKYNDSINWVAEFRTAKELKPEYVLWHFTKKDENDVFIYSTESTYKPIFGLYFPAKVYERKYTGKCEDWAGRKALCFQSNKYISVFGVYFTESSDQEYLLNNH